MMKLLKQSLVIPACLTLLTTSSQAALILEFNEIGGTQVELSFTGTVALGGYTRDNQNTTPVGRVPRLDPTGLLSSDSSEMVNATNFQTVESFTGDDLLANNVGLVKNNIFGEGQFLGFWVHSTAVGVASVLDADVANSTGQDVFRLSGETGGVLDGKTQTFNTTFVASGLDRFMGNGPQDLWRVTGTTGTANLIQFRVNGSSVPEPSSILMTGLGLLSLLTRRKRKA